MKLYNTLTRTKDEFVPLDGKTVKMYACGPTVYNFFHIGNARCFVVFDMLRRYLEWRGYDVRFVQNFTDIDDKMIKRANEEGTTVKEVAERYIAEYFKDAQGLGIRPATVHPRATENIDEIIGIVSTLIEKGHAYPVKVNDMGSDVYFRTLSFKEYGKLSHMPIDDLEKGARIDVSEKKEDALDFALCALDAACFAASSVPSYRSLITLDSVAMLCWISSASCRARSALAADSCAAVAEL